MSDAPAPGRTADNARFGEEGRTAYEARFADHGPRDFDPWDSLTPEVKAIWARVEAAAGEVMRARCMETVRTVYDGWAKNSPEERWVRVALSQAVIFIEWLPPRMDQKGG